ncbi:hypothetical protein LOTGIDRAFT_161440 [Lottia gigantea]|uniref:Uncharacterized protein n=1 Tax=Lottia gigantea TaxID=225164 RepID=V4AKW5_LOTGI|nr:hypothetical protein LOTGIDRAFT_161440 [Lottia gigantea]ESO94231.1 hypothetical protein LOTGIDRAFT_161440 [Lottia gigantea]
MNNHFHSNCLSNSCLNGNKQVIRRRGRKLPHVPRQTKYKPNVFWPTYRGAVSWLRQHQKILDTAIGLLEIYPNIISDYSLDSFWDFIKPFLYPDKSEKLTLHRKTTGNPKRPTKQTAVILPKINTKIPLISVTHDSDPENESEIGIETVTDNHKVSRVCVSGKLQDKHEIDYTPQIVEELTSFSFVFYISPINRSNDVLYEADSLIFLLGDYTLSDDYCCESLVSAWSLDIPTVFVRNKNFKLSSPLPDTFIKHAINIDGGWRGGGRSLSPSVGASSLRLKRDRFKRSDSATSVLTGSYKDSKASVCSSDLVFYLLNGYREAVVYDDKLSDITSREIKLLLSKKMEFSRTFSSMSKHPEEIIKNKNSDNLEEHSNLFNRNTDSGQFLRIPDPLECLNIETELFPTRLEEPRPSNLEKTMHLTVPPDIDQDPDSGVHSPIEKETFYLVYPDPLASLRTTCPQIVKWPPDEEDGPLFSPDSPSTLDSPITFSDIDLSKEINHDLSSPDGF